jgi:hypothetical protein
MMRHVDTFVVRLWSPADHATPAGDARGIARHVGTGRAAAFRDGEELLALLRELPLRGDDDNQFEPGGRPVEPAQAPRAKETRA